MNIKEATQALEDILEHHWRNPTTTRETTKIALKDLIEKERASAVREYDDWLYARYVGSDLVLDVARLKDAEEYLKTLESEFDKNGVRKEVVLE